MKAQPLLFINGMVFASLLLSSCANNNVVEEKNYSGFLSDYSSLKSTELESGRTVSMWVHPDFKNRKYNKLILDPVSFYPKPHVQKNVDKVVLDELQKELNARLLKIAQKDGLPITKISGSKTLRLESAITAIRVSKQEFSVRELIPIRLIFSAVEAAAGGRDYDVTIYLEHRVVDNNTNEVLVRGIRKGNTDSLANIDKKLSLVHVEGLLDDWGIDFQRGFLKFKGKFDINL